jgi:hypothetical protein
MSYCIPVVNQTFLRCLKITSMFWAEGSSHCSIYELSREVYFYMFWSFKERIYFKKPKMILQKENITIWQRNTFKNKHFEPH